MKSQSVSQERVGSEKEIKALLVDIFDRYRDTFEQHQWPWEAERWHQLVYCLLSSVEGRFGPDTHSASAVRVLIELGLLDIPLLAKAEEETTVHLRIVLERMSFSQKQSSRLVRALCGLAKCLDETYQGKVQLLLRTFGMDLVGQVLQALPLRDSLDQQSASLVVMHWLQDVLNLPVLVSSPGLQALLKETGARSEEVLAAADELDVNVALLDEILNRWVCSYPPRERADEQQGVT